MGKIDRFCEELQKMSDQCIPYAGEGYGGLGCSAYLVTALRRAGIIKQNESFWAGQYDRGVLTDTSRFEHRKFNPATLQRGDILYEHGVHTLAWDGKNGGVWEGAPKESHGVCDNGVTGVGHRTGHGYRNCGNGTYTWSDVYRIIDIQKVKEEIKEVAMDKKQNVKTIIDFLPTIKYGSNGSMVRALQTIMQKHGWYNDRIDGNAGPNTIAGIKLLQTALGVYVDGMVGPLTWTALLV